MIVEHIVQGSKNTSVHDFEISINAMKITASPGSYFQNGELKFTVPSESVFTVDSLVSDATYDLWVTSSGLKLLQDSSNLPDGAIDRLAWFTVPANTTDLSNIEVNIVKTI